YDGSELSKKALESALMLAKQDEKIVLDVLIIAQIPTHFGVVGEPHLDQAKELAEEVKTNLKTLPNKTSTSIVEGSRGRKIIDVTKKNNTDLIIMGSRGISGFEELFLGSVSHYVVQKSDCPVFIVK